MSCNQRRMRSGSTLWCGESGAWDEARTGPESKAPASSSSGIAPGSERPVEALPEHPDLILLCLHTVAYSFINARCLRWKSHSDIFSIPCNSFSASTECCCALTKAMQLKCVKCIGYILFKQSTEAVNQVNWKACLTSLTRCLHQGQDQYGRSQEVRNGQA